MQQADTETTQSAAGAGIRLIRDHKTCCFENETPSGVLRGRVCEPQARLDLEVMALLMPATQLQSLLSGLGDASADSVTEATDVTEQFAARVCELRARAATRTPDGWLLAPDELTPQMLLVASNGDDARSAYTQLMQLASIAFVFDCDNVPDGFRLLPKLPSAKMVSEGQAALLGGSGVAEAYAAMTAAAPAAPAVPGPTNSVKSLKRGDILFVSSNCEHEVEFVCQVAQDFMPGMGVGAEVLNGAGPLHFFPDGSSPESWLPSGDLARHGKFRVLMTEALPPQLLEGASLADPAWQSVAINYANARRQGCSVDGALALSAPTVSAEPDDAGRRRLRP